MQKLATPTAAFGFQLIAGVVNDGNYINPNAAVLDDVN